MKQKLIKNVKMKQSITNSLTAKNGFKEEDLLIEEFKNNKELLDKLIKFTNITYIPKFEKINGYKSDIIDNKEMKMQVKKYKLKQFGQVDRHWIKDLITAIPNFNSIKDMLKNLCEKELSDDKKYIKKDSKRLELNLKNYKKEQLDNFLKILNTKQDKLNFLEFIFLGTREEYKPNYICGIEYNKELGKKQKIIIYKTKDIIEYLLKYDFIIKESGTVIDLNDCISIQRKGGDNGYASSNQIQCKLKFSSLNIIDKLEYCW